MIDKRQEEASRIKALLPQVAFVYFNSEQLWMIYLGLDRLDLVEPLQAAVKGLASQIRGYGEECLGWEKLDEDYLEEDAPEPLLAIKPQNFSMGYEAITERVDGKWRNIITQPRAIEG